MCIILNCIEWQLLPLTELNRIAKACPELNLKTTKWKLFPTTELALREDGKIDQFVSMSLQEGAGGEAYQLN